VRVGSSDGVQSPASCVARPWACVSESIIVRGLAGSDSGFAFGSALQSPPVRRLRGARLPRTLITLSQLRFRGESLAQTTRRPVTKTNLAPVASHKERLDKVRVVPALKRILKPFLCALAFVQSEKARAGVSPH
jgi:hypothetical protein